VIATLVASTGSGVAGARAKSAVTKKPSRRSQLKAKLSSVFAKIRVVRTQLDEKKEDEARVSDLLQESQDRLERATQRLHVAKERVAAAKLQVDAATRRLKVAEAQLAMHQRRLSRRIAANYMMGSVSYADVLLGSQSISDFLDRHYLIEKVLDSDVSLLRALRAAQERVARERAALEQKRSQLAFAQQAIFQTVLAVTAERAKRAKLLAQIQNEREYIERMLDELERDSNDIASQLQQAARGSSMGGPLPAWGGPFVRPAAGRITSGFGYRIHPVLGYPRLHCGLDIGAGYGAPVRAAAAGRIFLAGFYRGYGRCIIIRHSGDLATLYGHLSAIANLQPGDLVKRGQLIGRVGATGLVTGPHLHFEVRRDGVPVNPASWTGR
jgi:murein DD-endopeptidase MepM/ murein hydrolase activator NlpD